MDNIQFWLYLAFGLIYFITRQMKKKKANNDADQEQAPIPQKPYKKPVTFEDLLKEFTQEQVDDEEDEIVEQRKPITVAAPKKEVTPIEEDHLHRRFADEESKKVYQNSIKQAEGADLKFERDMNFKSSIERSEQHAETSEFGAEIIESLRDADEAKKAIILSEIFNRKY